MTRPTIDHALSNRFNFAADQAQHAEDRALLLACSQMCRALENLSYRIAMLLFAAERSTPVGPPTEEKERPHSG
jgi:hypothetical protein